jgi:hypothetical protein
VEKVRHRAGGLGSSSGGETVALPALKDNQLTDGLFFFNLNNDAFAALEM